MAINKKNTTVVNKVEDNIEVKNEVVAEVVKEQPKKELNKIINDKTEVIVMNNTSGIFTYECPKTHDKIEMYSYGDTEKMTVEQLNTMRNRYREILDKYWIIPIGVNEDIELQDVLRYTRLDNIYKNLKITDDMFDNLLMVSTTKMFEKTLENMSNGFIERLAERAVMLFKDKRFVDYSKMSILTKKVNNEYLFEDNEK